MPNEGQFPIAVNDGTIKCSFVFFLLVIVGHADTNTSALSYLSTGPMSKRAEDLMPLLRIMAGPEGGTRQSICLSSLIAFPFRGEIRGPRFC